MGKITASDRLLFTLLFSAIIHISIVLGVGFGVTSPPTNTPLVNLEITLVKQQTEEAPEQADFFAQANNEGGGETDTKSPEPSPEQSLPVEEESASPNEKVIPEPIPTTNPSPEVEIAVPQDAVEEVKLVEKIKEESKPQTRPDKIITQEKAERIVQQVAEEPKQQQSETTARTKPKLSARDLKLPTQDEIALLEKQFDAATRALSKRPKKRKISAATKEYAAAAYMKAWEMKVERIGNFNYPQEAKQKNINGNLMLSVDINPDGSVPPDGIIVSRSSGHKVLDAAAIKIVRLGAPYAAIPDNVLKDNDMLTIIRTWKFETSRGLSAR
ncbi:MAG: TonB family protein [Gammaproteobacteria bacterium]|nr:TonB family protein [Gammaproteobacteria bacterium]